MIVRDKPSPFKMFFILRGSILQRIYREFIFYILLATAIVVFYEDIFGIRSAAISLLPAELFGFQLSALSSIHINPLPFDLLGLPLAIFLGFRNTVAYDRFGHCSKIWGDLIARCMDVSRQCQTFIREEGPVRAGSGLADVRARMTYRAIAFAHALRHDLRGTDPGPDLKGLVTASEFEGSKRVSNKLSYLMLRMGADLKQCLADKKIEPTNSNELDMTCSHMMQSAVECQRIKSTPIPFAYTLLLNGTVYIYCFFLPVGIVAALGLMTPAVVGIVAYTFFGLDALAVELEQPFEMHSNCLPLDSFCNTIEINLRESVEDSRVVEPLRPVDFLIT